MEHFEDIVILVASAAVVAALMFCETSRAVSVEPWGVIDNKNGTETIEINVDGCITSFTLPNKQAKRHDVINSILDLAEQRQANGCR